MEEEDKIDAFERRKKIVEFMLELRHLFALMVASQRKYVDPSKAVDILRGSIGKKMKIVLVNFSFFKCFI